MSKGPINLFFEYFKGRRTSGQMINLFKYFFGKKQSVVNWDPINISVFLTYKCNLSCNMCLTHSKKFKNRFGQRPAKDITFEFFKQILHRYKNAISLNLIGNGEPLMHEDLFKMIDYASNVMKMDVNSGSNGILVGNYINDILRSPLRQFDISLNGHNSDEFNRMTGMDPKLFKIICNNITELVRQRNARNSNLKIIASIILDQENLKYLLDMIYFAESLGVDQITFFQFLAVPEKGFRAEERCLFIDDPTIVEVFNKVNSLPQRILKKVLLPPLLSRTMTNNKYCPVWFYNISIDGDGNAGGCCCQILDLTPSGKFLDENVWNNSYFQEMRRMFIDPRVSLFEPCTWCYNNTMRSDWVSIINLDWLNRIVYLTSKLYKK